MFALCVVCVCVLFLCALNAFAEICLVLCVVICLLPCFCIFVVC